MFRRLKPSLCLMIGAIAGFAQQSGSISVKITDSAGSPLVATFQVTSRATTFSRQFTTRDEGRVNSIRIADLPFGPYVVEAKYVAANAQILKQTKSVVIDSQVPQAIEFQFATKTLLSTASVSAESDLLQTLASADNYIGSRQVEQRRSVAPQWAFLDLVQTQPGWLLEANGVLHPRGSEYDTQYVIDGIPLQDNRSPAFAPAIDLSLVESASVLTANFPAEFGRKLGGVVNVITRKPDFGWHGSVGSQTGQYGTMAANAKLSFSNSKHALTFLGDGMRTRRFLDPPEIDNFSNRGTLAGVGLRYQWDASEKDRWRAFLHSRQSRFLTPNSLEQEQDNHRGDRTSNEQLAQLSYQRVQSRATVWDARAMFRDVGARLWTDQLAEPIVVNQRRSFKESYFATAWSHRWRNHSLKVGGDFAHTLVHEAFQYRITEPDEFDDDAPGRFSFREQDYGRDASVFIEDDFQWKNLSASVGLRQDQYRWKVRQNAWSPRLGAAYRIAPLGLVVRASYDRVFQTPAVENILLASSRQAQQLTDETSGLPIPPARGNFWQVGFSKSIFGKARWDVNLFRRDIRNFADDDVFLNTGVSFPIAFDQARIRGWESRWELPFQRSWTALFSYSYLSGFVDSPVTGGLFLEEDEADLISVRQRFRLTQEQRHTGYSRLQRSFGSRVWVQTSGWYGSGLPIEREADDDIDGFDPRILERVDLERNRVRASWSMDLGAGTLIWQRDRERVRVQVDLMNLFDRLNVVNFSGAFSGTALAPGRVASVRAVFDF
jgi:outer membrane cobalamin receptor